MLKLLVWLGGYSLLLASAVQAQQVLPDSTLNTIVTRSNNDFKVTHGTSAGTNLFHSFHEFSIPIGGSATFDLTSTPQVSTIFSRVTGNTPSNIDGILRVVGKADLFLLNPNGVLFGQGAQLDLNGSLIATTANAIVFGNQGKFGVPNQTDLLTIQPSALWFGATPQSIVVRGDSPGYRQNIVSFAPAQLQVPIGKSLVLAGGDVHLVGASIGIDRAQIVIAGLTDSGQLNLQQTGDSWRVQPASSAPLANISLTQGAIISSRLGQESQISLQGNRISLSDRSRLKVASPNSSAGGTINIQAADLNLSDRALIASDAFRSGMAGKLQINATRSITVDQSLVSVTTYGTAPVGGELIMDTARLAVLNGGIIGTSTFHSGSAGSIRINATESIEVSGSGIPVLIPSTSTIESAAFMLPEVRQALNLPPVPSGNAGDVTINTNQLRVFDRGRINVRNEGTGNGGVLKVTANQIRLEQSGSLSAATESGTKGNIEIQAQMLLLRAQARLSATATGGDGGNIQINAPLMIGLENSGIIANSIEGKGGTIQITTQGILGFSYYPGSTDESEITASSDLGIDGTVEINTIGINPHAGLVELSQAIQDSNQQIAANCATDRESRFVITGRGGAPIDPTEQLSFNRPWADLRVLALGESTPAISPAAESLGEATAWYRNLRTGKVELIAEQTARSQFSATCSSID